MKSKDMQDKKLQKILDKKIKLSASVGAEYITVRDAFALANSYYTNRKSVLAIPVFEKIIEAAPKFVPPYFTLADCLMRVNRRKEARLTILKALEIEPRNVIALLKSAEFFGDMYENEKSFELYAKAYALAPNNSATMLYYAEVQLKKRNIDDAIQLWRRVMKVEPRSACAYHRLAEYDPEFNNEKNIRMLHELVKARQLDDENLSQAYFALAKLYKKQENIQREFEFLDKANSLVRAASAWTFFEEMDSWNKTKARYTSDFINKIQSSSPSGIIPVIFATLPRSGSTLVEQIISSHSNVGAAGESSLFLGAVWDSAAQLWPNHRHREWITEENCENFYKLIIKRAHEVLIEQRLDKKTITDKTINNYTDLGIMLCAFPEAKIIHCDRNQLDVCLSCYEQDFRMNNAAHANLEDMARMCNLFEEIMHYWKNIFPERILTVNYSELVNNPDIYARQIIDFCGLEWEEDCLKFYEKKQVVHTASRSQITSPINKKGLNRWRAYEKYLQPAIQILNMRSDQ